MKLSAFILLILVVGLSFSLVGSIIHDFETQYPDVDVNTTWEDDYDYAERINTSVYGIRKEFAIIGDEDTGWFSKIAAGITAIPKAIIAVPVVLFQTIGYAINIISDIPNIIGVPSYVIYTGIVALIVVVLFGLVSFWHRSKI